MTTTTASPRDIGTVFEASQSIPMRVAPLMSAGTKSVVVKMKMTLVAVDAETFVCIVTNDGTVVRVREEAYMNACVQPEHTAVVQAYLEACKAQCVFEVMFKHYL